MNPMAAANEGETVALTFVTHIVTSTGGRSINQDAARFTRADSGEYCWVLADGLGGQHGGEIAAELATETVIAAFHERPGVSGETLTGLAQAAQDALHDRQRREPDLDLMRTTLVLLVADRRSACWAHIGDSRLYLFRGGRLACQTRDHSVPQALAMAGQIAPAEVRHHADRSQLLRALGQPGSPDLEFASAPLAVLPNDAFLLCTDGSWEFVNELEMEADLAKSSDPETWLALLEDRLLARFRPDHDNYTMLAVFVTA
jgi:serine/threonine protein phosphatase PrpC